MQIGYIFFFMQSLTDSIEFRVTNRCTISTSTVALVQMLENHLTHDRKTLSLTYISNTTSNYI